MKRLLDAAGFLLVWLLGAFGAARGLPWLGPAAALIGVWIHLARVHEPRRECARLAAFAAVGAAAESAAIALGFFGYAGGWPVWWAPPAWVVSVWVVIGAALESSWPRVARRPRPAALAGAAAGPLMIAVDARLGAAAFTAARWASLAAVAAMWAAVLPLALAASRAAAAIVTE